MPKTHKLGFGNGAIIENEDGTASYRAPASFSQAFRVRIADVTGFSVSKGSKALERTLHVLGNGTESASASVTTASPRRSKRGSGRTQAMAVPTRALLLLHLWPRRTQ